MRTGRCEMFKWWTLGIVLILVGAVAAGGAEGDLSKSAKYAWRENQILARQTPEVIGRIDQAFKKAIDTELTQKGYLQDPKAPDFFIHVEGGPDFESKVGANTDIARPNETIYRSQNTTGAGVNAFLVVISQIRIVATDPSSEKAVWQAESTKKYKDPNKAIRNLDEEVSGIVRKAMKGFPVRKKTK
jgi:hypothetical protein